jgi:hypothetical protein
MNSRLPSRFKVFPHFPPRDPGAFVGATNRENSPDQAKSAARANRPAHVTNCPTPFVARISSEFLRERPTSSRRIAIVNHRRVILRNNQDGGGVLRHYRSPVDHPSTSLKLPVTLFWGRRNVNR